MFKIVDTLVFTADGTWEIVNEWFWTLLWFTWTIPLGHVGRVKIFSLQIVRRFKAKKNNNNKKKIAVKTKKVGQHRWIHLRCTVTRNRISISRHPNLWARSGKYHEKRVNDYKSAWRLVDVRTAIGVRQGIFKQCFLSGVSKT